MTRTVSHWTITRENLGAFLAMAFVALLVVGLIVSSIISGTSSAPAPIDTVTANCTTSYYAIDTPLKREVWVAECVKQAHELQSVASSYK